MVVVTPIYENWVPAYSISREEFLLFLCHCTLMFSYIENICLRVFNIMFISAFLLGIFFSYPLPY